MCVEEPTIPHVSQLTIAEVEMLFYVCSIMKNY